jgi:hypothetical protein
MAQGNPFDSDQGQSGNPPAGYQQGQYQQGQHQQPGYPQAGAGYPAATPQADYQQPGYQQSSYQQPRYQQPEYQQFGHQQPDPHGGTATAGGTGSGTSRLTLMAAAVPALLVLSLLLSWVVRDAASAPLRNGIGWSLVALICGTLVTVGTVGTTPSARQLRLVGAAGVALFWVLIVLPAISSNPALGVTAATMLALWVVWSKENPSQSQPGNRPGNQP